MKFIVLILLSLCALCKMCNVEETPNKYSLLCEAHKYGYHSKSFDIETDQNKLIYTSVIFGDIFDKNNKSPIEHHLIITVPNDVYLKINENYCLAAYTGVKTMLKYSNEFSLELFENILNNLLKQNLTINTC